MAKVQEVEVFVMIDSDGNYVAHHDGDRLGEFFEEETGSEVKDVGGMRVVRIVVKVPLPEMIELKGEVAAEEQAGELKVA